jgi:hypothetical protein
MIPDTGGNTEQVLSLGAENVLLGTLVLFVWLVISKVFMRCELCFARAQSSFKRGTMFIVEDESSGDAAPPKDKRRRQRRRRSRKVVKDAATHAEVEPLKPVGDA